MRIEIRKTIDSETAEQYLFNVFDLTAVFVGYHKEVKPPNKRKFRIIECWDSYSSHNSTVPEPELPEDVKYQALAKLQSLVNIKTWAEFQRK